MDLVEEFPFHPKVVEVRIRLIMRFSNCELASHIRITYTGTDLGLWERHLTVSLPL